MIATTFYYHVVDPLKSRYVTSVTYRETIETTVVEISDEENGVTAIIPDGALAQNTEIEIGHFNIIPDGAQTYGTVECWISGNHFVSTLTFFKKIARCKIIEAGAPIYVPRVD